MYQRTVFLYFIVLLAVSAVFFSYILPVVWMVLGITVVFLSFLSLYRLIRRWFHLPEKVFRKKVFWTAFCVRAAYVLISYYFYIFMTGYPFEFEAADAWVYHLEGLRLAKHFLSGNFDVGSLTFIEKLSSQGIVIIMGIVYAMFFDSIIAFRILNSLLGAWLCVMIFDIARRSFGEKAARISGVLAVVAPPLIYYCGLHLKAAVIVFLVVLFINTGDRLLKARQLSIRDILLLGVTAVSMVFFRNALAVVLVVSFAAALAFTSGRLSPVVRRFAIASVMAIFAIAIFSLDMLSEAEEESIRYLGYRETHIEGHMQRYARRGNELATLANRTIFAPLALIGPLPTLVDTEQDNSAMMAGSMFFRNVLGFFMIFGILLMVKNKQWRNHVFLLAVFFLWLFVLANSGYALQDRFHLILLPIIIIFSGNFILNADKKMMKYFSMYLVFLGALIFAWNTFKLAGRGLI
jgi:4-amino-4-deoxy-L-arabinose transferase-like glycosyltransferase